ncbi:hypothetical protein AB0L53_42000 [Nonomuraea sp. NPDC052129]|uniref:hypothetical protein n=1 Tax=Nonomuraea sp. NPDC052129 TaxID=3154651 RepID=UPI003440B629
MINAEVGSDARRLFEREFAILRRVSSFCTAQVLDADVTADPPYIVSEYVAGQSLHAFVAEHGPLTGAELPLSIMDLGVGSPTEPRPAVRKPARWARRTILASSAIATALILAGGALWWARGSVAYTIINSFDYKTLDKDLRAVDDATTGRAGVEYTGHLQDQARQIRDEKMVQRAVASESGIVTAQADQVVVLVWGQINTTKGSTSDYHLGGVVMEMRSVGTVWKLDHVWPLSPQPDSAEMTTGSGRPAGRRRCCRPRRATVRAPSPWKRSPRRARGCSASARTEM